MHFSQKCESYCETSVGWLSEMPESFILSYWAASRSATVAEMHEVNSDGNSCSSKCLGSSRDADGIHFSCSST